MPTFFNPRQLTEVQQTNWAAAIAEYARVQQTNPSHWLAQATKGPEWLLMSDGSLMQAAKSALFARLLEGKPALIHPPPTSYSYPWYAVIEEPGPHQVCVNGSTDGRTVGLNQCAWAIRHMNDAAKELWALNTAKHTACWSLEWLSKVKAAYAKGPQLMVQFEPWSNYRLFVAACQHTSTQAAMPYALDMVHVGVQPGALAGSVWDVDALKLHAKIGATLADFKPSADSGIWVELFFDRWHLEKVG